MQDSKSLLPFPQQLVGSYVYAYQANGFFAYQTGVSAGVSYKNCQVGGGAFSVANGTGAVPTVISLRVAGIVMICANEPSTDGAAVIYSVKIREPGDSGFRAVTSVSGALSAGNRVNYGSPICLPLPAGTEIVVDSASAAGAGTANDIQEGRYLTTVFIAETSLRTQIRYGT